jgi:hypothetical protein
MSKGILIFAYNSKINYVEIATIAARLAKKHLDLPVSIVTNSVDVDYETFDRVIFQEIEGEVYQRSFKYSSSSERMPWHNQNRSSAYELSPYDQTLLIDADYLMFNDSLGHLFDTDLEFACFDDVHDLSGRMGLKAEAHVGRPGIPMQWATVVYFIKCPLAKAVFDYMQNIKEHYAYYSAVYNFEPTLFRNDFTLSIALQVLTGYAVKNFSAIPGTLITANTGVDIVDVRDNGEIVFSWNGPDGRMSVSKIKNTNVHIMNKRSITDPEILKKLGKLSYV